MKTLLGYIGKERHADSLVEKLMLRFEAAHKPEQWKNLAFCLTQVCTSSRAKSYYPPCTIRVNACGCICVAQDILCAWGESLPMS